LEFKGSWAGKPWANIMHAKFSGGPPSAADLTTIGTAFAANYNFYFLPLMSAASLRFTSVKVSDLSTAASASAEPTVSFSGGNVNSSVPNSVAFGIEWHAATRYRGGHPKTFLPGYVAVGLADSLSWTSGTVTTTQTAVNGFLTSAVGISGGTTVVGGLVVVHFRRANIILTNPLVEDIGAGTAKANIYSLRGRRT